MTTEESAAETSADAANTPQTSSAGENSLTGSTEIAAAGEGSVSEDGSEENSVAESSESAESKESKETAQEADPRTDTAESAAGSTESVAEDSTSDELTENAEAVSFKEMKVLDGVSITVSADPGVFPEGCMLQITNASSKESDEAKSAVDEKRPDDVTVAASYVFDISVLDSTGTRIEPDTNAGKVSVSFAAAEAEDKNLDPAVYHVTGESGELSAEALDTTAVSGDTVTAQTDGFSLYVVEFTYGDLAYTLKGDSSVLLSDILEAVGLTGEATNAKSSNPELFTVTTNEEGKLVVNALKAFDTKEILTVTIKGTEYQIAVADAQQEEAQQAATSADYNTTAPSPTWEYSKSISATDLEKDADGNYLSNVTISLPSAQEQLATEVCFVLDKSQFSKTKDSALKLLSELKEAITQNGAKVKVDIVEFNRTAHNHGSYDLATQYDTIVEQFEEQNSGGTNMHAGLLMAKEVLASDASIPDSRKYMILVSDGDSYLYCKNGDYNTPYSRSYISVENAGGTAYGGYYDESWYNPSAGYTDPKTGKTNVKRPTTSGQDDWKAYLNDVAARNSESNGDSYDFIWKWYDGWKSMAADEVAADGFKKQPAVPRSASNLDMGFLNAASAYHDLAAKYHCYAMAAPSWNTADGGHSAFMNYLNNGANTEFESIKNEILYYLDAGSTVEETLGYTADYNFDLFNPEKMTISVDNTEDGNTTNYSAEKIGNNHYGFGPKLQDGSYSYEVTYTPGAQDDEKFVWKINVPVTNFMRIHLNYQVKLMNPKTEPGTYGEYDEYGTGHKSSLYVSNRAVLNPVASDGTKGDSEDFEKPTVSYTVQASQAPQPANPASEGGPGSVNLYKVDGQTGAYLAGAVFALYHSDGTYIGTYTTNEKGCIHVDSLGYGTYYFTETKAPAGYVQDPTYIRFVMNEATSKSNAYPWNIRFSNTKSGTATVTVGGTKTWADNNNAAGTRPDAVTLHLLANGTEVGTAVATKENGWAYSFGAQAAVDGNGKAIQYTVTEDAVTGYTASVSAPVTENDKIVINVTNTYTGAKAQAVSTSGSSAAAAGVATGDESHIGVYITLLLAAAAGLAGMILQRRKNQN